ncbi:hypothetical protein [Streptomyces sp. Ag109_G2-15]|uniref:hypothetical protein n=1 Tax=Streptomyces sp. Ag109_G2-15 TaxID=1938850 RepID=UPI000BD79BAF|nr:hypothetical protein [Streptomyces sp. Ag109_G2-15]SOD81784.1 hypothetical protein SAMN06272765_0357 [Streptomyces sp. Ag109_G2-15]
MSFDLAFWYSKDPVDASTALEIYRSILDEASDVVAPNSAVGDFLADVVKVFPDLTEENMDNSPWMSPLYYSDAYVVASISWSRQQVMARALTALARKHGLVCYDPQAEAVIS